MSRIGTCLAASVLGVALIGTVVAWTLAPAATAQRMLAAVYGGLLGAIIGAVLFAGLLTLIQALAAVAGRGA